MLLYKSTLQPPRKYPYAPHVAKSNVPADIQELTADTQDPDGLCNSCHSYVWTSSLYTELSALVPAEQIFRKIYEIDVKALRDAVEAGCVWCQKLADGIHGHVFLNAVQHEWARTDGGSGSGSEQDDGEDHFDRHEKESVTCDNISEERSETVEDEEPPNGASAFNKEEIENDRTGRENSYSGEDILTLDATFSIALSFERGENDRFTILTVRIQAVDKKEDNLLRKLRDEDSVLLRWRVNMRRAATNDDMDRNHKEFFPLQPVTSTLGSEANMTYTREWARKSTQTMDKSSLQMPSRLIELQPDSLRVVETSILDAVEESNVNMRGYAALSYVWGQNQTFVLLDSTKDVLMSSFDIVQLPRTIQDAVIVTRTIGLTYLWVDALCIIQDSEEDKAIELPKMRLIYQNAAITLIASVAKSAIDGFLHHIPSAAYLVPPIHIPIPPIEGGLSEPSKNDPSQCEAMVLSYPALYTRHRDPINMRAWTFQELLLSPRCLMFTYRGIETVDRLQVPSPDGLTSGLDPQMQNLPWNGPMFTSAKIKEEGVRSAWLNVRREYSSRQLSYEGDKLVAIAAVAEEAAKAYTGRYLAGLWEIDLERELKWCRGDHIHEETTDMAERRPRYGSYVAPSWSWASIREPVDDYAFDEYGDAENEALNRLGFRILRAEVGPVIPGYEFGAVRSGILAVEGRTHSFFWRPEKAPMGMQSDGFLAVKAKNECSKEWNVGEAIIDAFDPELVDGCVVESLAMGLVERISGTLEVEGLMLLPVKGSQYRRVGFCRIWVMELFEDVEEVEIEII